MKSIVFQDTLCFSVDPESGEILSASDPELTGRAAAELGLPKAAMEDAYMGFFRFDGKDVYGKTTREDDVVYIYTVDSSRMYDGLLKVTLSVLCTYLVLMGAFVLFMLGGYRKEFQQYADTGEVLKEADRVVTPSGKVKRSIDPSRRWGFTYAGYGSRTPAHNAGTAGVVVYVIGMFAVVVLVISGRLREDNSAIAFILQGKWTRGMNLFAIANVLFLFIQISVGTILLKALLRAVTMYLGTKGETIGRLFLSLANYISAIVFVFFTLSYIGIDTTTLVASLGLMTFALSIGAQDLVKDILAGLAIVFDGAYQVGDIIEVNGFRGKVLEVGVRSVKLEGRDGNILIVGNRDVKNVINKTRRNSWYRVEVSVSEGQDLKMIEALLRENLPKIGEKIPEIISGPFYEGIVSIGTRSVTMSIIAECEEEDYYSVQRKLNGAVVELFLSQGISI
jgi:small conductance mechanosensitive channel